MRLFTLGFLFVAACDLGSVDSDVATTAFGRPGLPPVTGGEFAALTGYSGIGGLGYMLRTAPNATELYMSLSGVVPNVMYTAHLHVAPCAAGGGGHYKVDPGVPGVIEANELWLTGISSAVGTLFAIDAFSHGTRAEAKAIVLHDHATGAKMACADLNEL